MQVNSQVLVNVVGSSGLINSFRIFLDNFLVSTCHMSGGAFAQKWRYSSLIRPLTHSQGSVDGGWMGSWRMDDRGWMIHALHGVRIRMRRGATVLGTFGI